MIPLASLQIIGPLSMLLPAYSNFVEPISDLGEPMRVRILKTQIMMSRVQISLALCMHPLLVEVSRNLLQCLFT